MKSETGPHAAGPVPGSHKPPLNPWLRVLGTILVL